MSRRRVRPRGGRGLRSDDRPRSVLDQRVEVRRGGEFVVRHVTGSASAKAYRCPGCDHLIAPATPHVVAWPGVKPLLSEAALDERRHWHAACWARW